MRTRLRQSREGRLVRLTLARPEKRNAIDVEMTRALIGAIGAANHDSDVGAILLDAEGPVFCAGMDVAEVLRGGPDSIGPHQALFGINGTLTKPMVAAVHGAALGGGLGLALNAHMIVASEEAKIGLTEIRLGLWPFMIFQAVEAAVGARRATALSLTGEVMTAREAKSLGLVDVVIAPDDLARRAREIAVRLSEGSTQAQTFGLEYVHGERSLGRAAEFRVRAQSSPDFLEGARAFLEKRAPVWPSHRRGSGEEG